MFRLINIIAQFRSLNNSRNYATIIKMPSLSPTMSEGGIIEWHKKEGDKVSAGDVICDIQTDKTTIGLEADDDGVLAKIIHPNNTQNLKIGTMIAIMADEDEDWKSIKIPSEVATSQAVTPEADKQPAVPTTATATPNQDQQKTGDDNKIGPAVRRLLDSYGINSNDIKQHSGPKNVLLKSDVMQYIDSNKLKQLETPKHSSIPSSSRTDSSRLAQASDSTRYKDIPLTSMRQTIAKRMLASKLAVPHQYTTGSANLDKLLAIRKKLKENNIAAVSVNDFVVKACAYALRMVPDVNNSFAESTGQPMSNSTVDISIAVASDAGLITPIVFNADRLAIDEIGEQIRQLADKARRNKLQPHEFMGGTFTISNLGMFGIKQFTAIINNPQAAILAVGSGLVQSSIDSTTGKLTETTNMRYTLSSDVRVVSQASAGAFLDFVTKYLESPEFLVGDILDNHQHNNQRSAWGY